MAQALQAYLARISRIPLLTAAEEVELAKRIEAGTYAEHLLEESPVLRETPDGDDLRAVAVDGTAARDHLIRANLRLVVSIAYRYAPQGMSALDVIQDGNVGLIGAIDHFDHARGLRFSTCATWWIRKAILCGLETSRAVRVPAHVRDELLRLRRKENRLALEWGRVPAAAEIASELGLTPARVAKLTRLARICDLTSLDLPIGTNTLGGLIEDAPWSQPESIAERHALKAAITAAEAALDPQQAQVIRGVYGLAGAEQATRAKMAARLGLTGPWVRRLERKALVTLRGDPSIAEWDG